MGIREKQPLAILLAVVFSIGLEANESLIKSWIACGGRLPAFCLD